ncbi:MAG: type II toxin-antitoxin system HicB family antitoxin [Chlamydiae bacterium]|nr:type II toxin-antitoxin system HicB family antitoxin [Chlamydiota bacterium]
MEFEGKVWKDGKFWLIEVPALNVMTQGKTKREALEMVQDNVFELIECYFKSEMSKSFAISVNEYKEGIIGIAASDNKLLLALSLRKQREKSGCTVREASFRLGSKSPNAYAQYEKGRTNISLDKYEALLMAANPFEQRHLRIA